MLPQGGFQGWEQVLLAGALALSQLLNLELSPEEPLFQVWSFSNFNATEHRQRRILHRTSTVQQCIGQLCPHLRRNASINEPRIVKFVKNESFHDVCIVTKDKAVASSTSRSITKSLKLPLRLSAIWLTATTDHFEGFANFPVARSFLPSARGSAQLGGRCHVRKLAPCRTISRLI